ncbi:hypothetical protein OSJ77_03170 [Phyllobacterium sp. 0TCS1.6C]|uniref:hypothetical protein n=1 Tax=unclassified Phyllobacterium TaxID=2638441 RepID=UPI0022640B04|nr:MULTISPECIES: hypothetical protein [unclassified Phyllobacterium]MCX8279180.1 hypothetical protein [Phyllobacterium sp. 0TCS1.6C]MCX8293964.1 hypothetical protein [Phyllobacterium sp. 0TCS1.6A]
MSDPYPYPQYLTKEFAFQIELHWVVSDQAVEFDDELCMPVRNRAFMQSQAKHYFEVCATIPPDADEKLSFQAFDGFLEALRKGGDDPERLILWHAAMQEHLTPVDQPREKQNIGPYLKWRDTLHDWVRGSGKKSTRLPSNRFDAFIATYRDHVARPSQAFKQRVEASEEQWLAGKRTRWDDYLWDVYFVNQEAAPSLFFGLDMDVVYFRRWWRAHHDFLTAPEKETLFSDLTDHIQADDRGWFEFVDWNDVQPIDEAIDIDNIPDFDKLKRDW